MQGWFKSAPPPAAQTLDAYNELEEEANAAAYEDVLLRLLGASGFECVVEAVEGGARPDRESEAEESMPYDEVPVLTPEQFERLRHKCSPTPLEQASLTRHKFDREIPEPERSDDRPARLPERSAAWTAVTGGNQLISRFWNLFYEIRGVEYAASSASSQRYAHQPLPKLDQQHLLCRDGGTGCAAWTRVDGGRHGKGCRIP